MNRAPAKFKLLAYAGACALLMACSHATGSGPAGAGAALASGAAAAGSVCDRHVLKSEDVAGILSAPITGTKPLPGDAQSCEFSTASFPAITVSVRPGLGRTTVEAWATGKMPLTTSPLSGVGEAAVWQDSLHEVIAQKNALLCDIQVRGGGSDLAISSSALPAALGVLCNRIFAVY
jgi:hypothetical protein